MTGSIDEARRRRIRWRARRGLLENDILLERYLDRRLDTMSESDLSGLDELLDLPDRDLMSLLMQDGPDRSALTPAAQKVLEDIRASS